MQNNGFSFPWASLRPAAPSAWLVCPAAPLLCTAVLCCALLDARLQTVQPSRPALSVRAAETWSFLETSYLVPQEVLGEAENQVTSGVLAEGGYSIYANTRGLCLLSVFAL